MRLRSGRQSSDEPLLRARRGRRRLLRFQKFADVVPCAWRVGESPAVTGIHDEDAAVETVGRVAVVGMSVTHVGTQLQPKLHGVRLTGSRGANRARSTRPSDCEVSVPPVDRRYVRGLLTNDRPHGTRDAKARVALSLARGVRRSPEGRAHRGIVQANPRAVTLSGWPGYDAR